MMKEVRFALICFIRRSAGPASTRSQELLSCAVTQACLCDDGSRASATAADASQSDECAGERGSVVRNTVTFCA